ncbi:dehydrogenase E1 component subunit alpha/beta [Streptomyces sp. NBC_00038]|uniref:alpha-ketoacid dehydrogenase subunit alpha/beta n=1 Tax=Streptomyces sp. NBC_00038 TaxID=2903615 RepID=UPI002259A509|nr:dehydrogenase E1 component subunit alpha/beta [Streptomyces sp. NBC_00038]MCX5562212.1 dehydrogenase E1 component subunit alpha/beta [Streptomyces sp. NBC_00038]
MVTSVSEAPAAQAEAVVELYRRMRRIREFETRTSALYKAGEVPGFVHLSIGQEATAVGACRHLREDDVVTSTHRGHGHCLAKGLGADQMMAELMGRDSGTCRGRGGSMHIADPEQGIFGANGIVGAGLPIAVGAATAAQLRGGDSVVVSFFGDGAVAQGMFHEAVNLAGVWDLPVVFFCENNQYAEFSRASDQHRATLKERAVGYGVPYRRVDGNDVIAVADVMDNVIAHTRAGHGPFLVEAFTYRWHGHYEGDPEHYRTGEELASWRERDPLNLAYDKALAAGATPDVLIEVDVAVRAEIDAAVEHARQAEAPKPASLFDFVTAPRPDIPEPPAPSGEPVKMMAAIREAIEREMTDDPSVFMAGIDVAQGNVFGLFRGMADAFPGRVRDTPISETAIVGTAVGAALAGFRPVVEIMYMDFIGVCLDGLMNQAAKLRFMTGGRASLPLVVRTQFGAGRSSGSQHSQSLEAVLAHIPGLTVVMPSNPADAYGLMRAAIRDPNPVVFIENRLQYGMKGPRPEPDHLVPLGRAKVVREGRDVSVVSWSRMLTTVLQAADRLAEDGISAEVIDLRTISPLDRETVLRSLERTHRLVIVHEAVQDFGVGAELAALAANEGFWHLDAPVARVAPPAIPSPYAPSLEKLWLPDADAIADTVRRVVRS